jgi:hypothetical protein
MAKKPSSVINIKSTHMATEPYTFETGTLYGCVTSPVLDSQHSMYAGMM